MEPIFVTTEWTLRLANLFRLFVRLMHVLTFSFSCKICRCKTIGIRLRSAALLSLSFMMFYNDDDEPVEESKRKKQKGNRFGRVLISIAIYHCPNGIRFWPIECDSSFSVFNLYSERWIFFPPSYCQFISFKFELEALSTNMLHNNPNVNEAFSNDANAKNSHNSFSDQCQSEESEWYVLAI